MDSCFRIITNKICTGENSSRPLDKLKGEQLKVNRCFPELLDRGVWILCSLKLTSPGSRARCWMRMCFSIKHFCNIKHNRGTTIGPFIPVPHWHVIECIFFESVIVKGVHFPFYKVKWIHPTHCGFFFSTFGNTNRLWRDTVLPSIRE